MGQGSGQCYPTGGNKEHGGEKGQLGWAPGQRNSLDKHAPTSGPRDILPVLPIIFPVSSCAPQGVSEGLRPWSCVRC